MDPVVEELKKNTWQISDFTKRLLDDMALLFPNEKISYHFNTVDGWFKEMEKRGIHYVQRSSGEKIYDSLDLEIAKFIVLGRREKLTLDQIYAILPEKKETRPFPPDDEVVELPKSYEDMIRKLKADIKADLKEEVKKELKKELETDYELKLKRMFQQQLIEDRKVLESGVSERMKEQQRELSKKIIQQQLELEEELQKEAIDEWRKLPESERMIKPGIFSKKIENASAKAEFIRSYKNKNLPIRLEKLFKE